jgi:uncharacterized membrane protein
VRDNVTVAAIGMLAFMVADGLWLGVLMTTFYRDQLAPIARLANGAFAPNWPAALAVYVLLGIGIAGFVVPRSIDLASAAGYGALFGLVVYGVYDLTNLATLRQWPVLLAVVDLTWGVVATASCSALAWSLTR